MSASTSSPAASTDPPPLRVGCAMWAEKAWVGTFLPRGEPILTAYSQRFAAVEGNTTFYATPPSSTVARWASEADPAFRFIFKAPRTITHDARLRDVDGALSAFVDLLAPLERRLGGITLQLPPSFGPDDLDVLDGVLARASTSVRWSVELRHPAFFTVAADGTPVGAGARLQRMLAARSVERVIMDTRPLRARPPRTDAGRDAWVKKPDLPVPSTAVTDHPIVRCIGHDDDDVTEAGLAAWEETVRRWLAEGRRPTVFVHTPDNGQTPRLARAWWERMRSSLSSSSSSSSSSSPSSSSSSSSWPSPRPLGGTGTSTSRAPQQGSLF